MTHKWLNSSTPSSDTGETEPLSNTSLHRDGHTGAAEQGSGVASAGQTALVANSCYIRLGDEPPAGPTNIPKRADRSVQTLTFGVEAVAISFVQRYVHPPSA